MIYVLLEKLDQAVRALLEPRTVTAFGQSKSPLGLRSVTACPRLVTAPPLGPTSFSGQMRLSHHLGTVRVTNLGPARSPFLHKVTDAPQINCKATLSLLGHQNNIAIKLIRLCTQNIYCVQSLGKNKISVYLKWHWTTCIGTVIRVRICPFFAFSDVCYTTTFNLISPFRYSPPYTSTTVSTYVRLYCFRFYHCVFYFDF